MHPYKEIYKSIWVLRGLASLINEHKFQIKPHLESILDIVDASLESEFSWFIVVKLENDSLIPNPCRKLWKFWDIFILLSPLNGHIGPSRLHTENTLKWSSQNCILSFKSFSWNSHLYVSNMTYFFEPYAPDQLNFIKPNPDVNDILIDYHYIIVDSHVI